MNAPYEQKYHHRENFFSYAVFSRPLKIRKEKFHAAKPLAFSLHLQFRPKLSLQSDFKNHENVWTDLKKDSSPIQFKISEL